MDKLVRTIQEKLLTEEFHCANIAQLISEHKSAHAHCMLYNADAFLQGKEI